MHNSIYWLLVVAASFFFIAATTLAQAGWPLVFRRVPEAISGGLNVLGPVTLIILLAYVWISDDHHIYHWKDAAHLDEKLQAKLIEFLNSWDNNSKGWVISSISMQKMENLKPILEKYSEVENLKNVIIGALENSPTKTDKKFAKQLEKKKN